jgi:hypothetical protein
MRSLLGALLVAGSALCAQVIEGTVVNSVTGQPIAGASVDIAGKGAAYKAVSDAQGAFRIEGVADGVYTPKVEKGGFRAAPDALRRFRIAAGINPDRLQLPLIPLGKLSGIVFDGQGRPVSGAEVSLLNEGGAGQSTITNVSGTFSFDNIPPGNYFLSARPARDLTSPAPVGDERYGWVPTWYPNLDQRNPSAKITVQPGADLLGQDIKLLSRPVHNLRGKILDLNGDPAPKLPVRLTQHGGAVPVGRDTASAANGTFEFADLYDGGWELSAEVAGSGVTLRALQSGVMSGRDNEGTQLQLSRPFSVPLDFVLETPDSTRQLPSNVILRPLFWGGSVVPVSTTDAQGHMRIDGVYPGAYRVMPIPVAGSYYLASIMLGTREMLGQDIEFNDGADALKIVYKSDGGTIRGTVEDCGGATVIVAPEDPTLRRGEYSFTPSSHCTDDGHFELRNLRPGRYLVFAFAQLDGTVADFLSSLPMLIDKAVTVEVRAGETSSAELKVTSMTPW